MSVVVILVVIPNPTVRGKHKNFKLQEIILHGHYSLAIEGMIRLLTAYHGNNGEAL